MRARVADAVLECQIGQIRSLRPHRVFVDRDAIVEIGRPNHADGEILLAAGEVVGREPIVFTGQRQPHRVDFARAEHRIQVDRSGVVAVPFLLRGGQRDGCVVGLVLLRRKLRDPARAPAVIRADLVIDAIDGVDDAGLGHRRVVQIRPRRNLDRSSFVQPHALEVGEEVHFVLHNRPANRAAELVLLRIGLGQVVLRLKKILRPQILVVEELEGAAMNLVRARLDHGVDDRARGAAELGVELAGEHLKFLRGVERHARLRAVVLTEIIVVVPRAVHQVAVVARIDAVGGQRVGTPRRQVRGRDDAGKQAGEVGEVARDARNVRQLFRADVAADLLRRDVDDRRLAGHRNRLFERAELELDVDGHLVADGQHDVAADEPLEALELRRDLILARAGARP